MPDLDELAAGIRVCPACDLCRTRTLAVPGEGPAGARIFLIGEGPGYYEDKSGRPFVGPAGKFLDELLALAGLRRADVFITNVVKCRPPNNRDPLEAEIDACKTWLDQQLEIVQPRVVVTLGRYSMGRYFPGESISRIHGQPRPAGSVTVVPMFHPAAALHQQRYRSLIEDDFRRLPEILAGAESNPAPQPPPASRERPAGDAASQMRLL
jgi:uracil-DNA glycosylase family 4